MSSNGGASHDSDVSDGSIAGFASIEQLLEVRVLCPSSAASVCSGALALNQHPEAHVLPRLI